MAAAPVVPTDMLARDRHATFDRGARVGDSRDGRRETQQGKRAADQPAAIELWNMLDIGASRLPTAGVGAAALAPRHRIPYAELPALMRADMSHISPSGAHRH